MSAEQPTSTALILGLLKEIKDPGTGAPATFHVVSVFQIALQHGGSAAVTFASYFSREAHSAGLSPLAHVTLQLKAVPTGDSAHWPTWFAEQTLANEVNLLPGQAAHPLAGAVAVRAEEPTA